MVRLLSLKILLFRRKIKMENGSLSASDVALLSDRNGYGDMWGGNSMMWIFALLILAGGGFNG